MTLIEGRKTLKYVTIDGAVVLSFIREGVSEFEESRNNIIASRV